jgi:hypothetical protein
LLISADITCVAKTRTTRKTNTVPIPIHIKVNPSESKLFMPINLFNLLIQPAAKYLKILLILFSSKNSQIMLQSFVINSSYL